MSAVLDRVGVLLQVVPYLVAHADSDVAETAAQFGLPEAELRGILKDLWLTEIPGQTPYCAIDLEFSTDERQVTVTSAAFDRPLRLQAEEALLLVQALRAVRTTPGLVDGDAVDRALRKLEAACQGDLADAGPPATLVLRGEVESLHAARDALARRRRLHLRYWSAGRDEISERDVDPIRLLTLDGNWYLRGYCRLVDDVRTFRLDRVIDIAVLDAVAEVPTGADGDDGARFHPPPDAELVTLDLDLAARWVAEYYPCESVAEHAGGVQRVTLRVGDTAWVRRLVLRQAGAVRVVEPAALAEETRARAEAALAAYAHHPPGD